MIFNKIQRSLEKAHSSPEGPSNYKWAVLFTSFIAFVAFAFMYQMVPPLLIDIQKDFSISKTEAGFLMSMVVFPGIFLSLPVIFLVNKYGYRLLGILSLLLVALGSFITASANNFIIALFGRFIVGLGGSFIIVGIPPIIPQWFNQEELGRAMGIFGINMPLGTVVAFSTAHVLSQFSDWRFPFYVGVIICIISAIVFAVIVKEGPLKNKKKFENNIIKETLRNVDVWKIGILWMFFNVVGMSYTSWAPSLFQQFRGFDPVYASLLASVNMYMALIFVPLFGTVSDKLGRRKPFLIIGPLASALTLFLIPYTSEFLLLVLIICLGIATSMIPPIILTITAEILSPETSVVGFSYLTIFQSIGVLFSVPLTGYIIQQTISFEMPFFEISAFSILATLVALTIHTK